MKINDIIIRSHITQNRAGAVLPTDPGERQPVDLVPCREVLRSGELEAELHGFVRFVCHDESLFITSYRGIEEMLAGSLRDRQFPLPGLQVGA